MQPHPPPQQMPPHPLDQIRSRFQVHSRKLRNSRDAAVGLVRV
jgi:hypothetical protein